MWLGEARRRFQGGARRKHAKMIDDQDLGLFAGFLAIFIFTLVIAYHHVLANQNFEGNQHLTIMKLQRSSGYEIVSASTLQTKEQANISNIPYVVW
ncbi:uncharacterized protein [Typha latifolia]|uniref:uncharacterized protein isoform X1 n=1 Tax=Typha latifolia TaxID=4733 RepID=UPI003C2B0DCB